MSRWKSNALRNIQAKHYNCVESGAEMLRELNVPLPLPLSEITVRNTLHYIKHGNEVDVGQGPIDRIIALRIAHELWVGKKVQRKAFSSRRPGTVISVLPLTAAEFRTLAKKRDREPYTSTPRYQLVVRWGHADRVCRMLPSEVVKVDT